jgi:DNA-binding CsgD family transcriptional regulator/tetratricopeptide (TPR) repeat protein
VTIQRIRQSKNGHAPLSGKHLVGRLRELTLLWNHYKAAIDGSFRVVLLSGEPGIGKTRLLDEIALRALGDGAVVLRGATSESEGMPPYLPFLEALGEHIRVTPLDQLRKQVTQAPQLLTTILPELASRIGELPKLHSAPPEQACLRLYEAIGTFLEVISMQSGLVLMLDDLHWADSASLDLLCYIARHFSKARLLVLGTCREGEIDQNPAFDRTVNELIRQRIFTRITVEPLSSVEIEELAVGYLGAPVSSTISQLLYEQSEGNPLFAEELIRDWKEVGTLVQENNQWLAVTSPVPRVLPLNIVGILRQRFSRLSSNIINHLRNAAIIGRTFDVSLLASVEDQEVEIVEECLLKAMRAGLVRAGQNGTFTFSHDIIREYLYAEVSASRRRRVHEIIGRILEAQYEQKSSKSTNQLAELAFHFTRSGDRERGATYSQLAAEQASGSLAFDEAKAHYRMALELLDADDERRGKLLLHSGEIALLRGTENEAIRAYEAALAWFLRSNELEAAGQAVYGLGLAQWRHGDLQAARANLEYALELWGNQLRPEVARALVDLSMLLTIYMGQQDEGITCAQQALEMAHRLGDRSLEAAATRAMAGKLYASTHDISNAIQSLKQALALAEESDDLAEAAQCCLYLAGGYYLNAEVKRSYEMSLRGLEFIERCQHPEQIRYAYTWHALLLSSQGRWAKAEQAIEHARTTGECMPGSTCFAFLHQVHGFLAYQQEDYAAAERELQAAQMYQQRGPGWLMFQTGLPGLIQVAKGKREEAHACMIELEALLSELPKDKLPIRPIMVCLALLAVALRDQEQAAKFYPELLAMSGQHYWFLVDRVLGEVATLLGDWEKASMHLSTAEAIAQRENLRPELARILLAQANCEVARGDPGSLARAPHLLKRALHLFERLSMTEAASRVRNQLRIVSLQPSSTPPLTLPARLTRSEARVLRLVVQGKSSRQIAEELGISEKTVTNHLSHIFEKTGSENRAAATAFAIRNGLA